MTFKPTRRAVVAGIAGSMAMDLRAFAQTLPPPKSPVTLNIVDVAGNLALTQEAIEAYRDKNPKLVSKITFTKAPAPELPGKLKAQQAAGRVDIDLVLTGTDALSAGIEQKLWIPIAAEYAAKLPNLDDIYLPGAAKMQELAQNQGIVRRVLPGRPAARIQARQGEAAPPTTAQELLAWCKANPEPLHLCAAGQFRPGPHVHHGPALHPRRQGPEGPGQRLGQDLGLSQGARQYIEYYPTGTGAVMKELGEGSRDMTPSHDRLGHQPARRSASCRRKPRSRRSRASTGSTTRTTWCIPKGVAATSSRWCST